MSFKYDPWLEIKQSEINLMWLLYFEGGKFNKLGVLFNLTQNFPYMTAKLNSFQISKYQNICFFFYLKREVAIANNRRRQNFIFDLPCIFQYQLGQRVVELLKKNKSCCLFHKAPLENFLIAIDKINVIL